MNRNGQENLCAYMLKYRYLYEHYKYMHLYKCEYPYMDIRVYINAYIILIQTYTHIYT